MQRERGQLEESEQSFRHAFELQQQFNEAFPDASAEERWQARQAQSRWSFGELLRDSGRLQEAADEFRLAFETCPATHNNKGPYLQLVADVQYRLGNFAQAREIFKESERMIWQDLETRTRILGPENPETLGAMNGLAWAFMRKASLRKLARSLKRPSICSRRVLGREHRQTLSTQDTLAESLEGLGLWAEARVLREEVLTLSGEERDASFWNGLALNIALTEDTSPDDRQRAIELAQEAVDLEPKNEKFWRTLGVALAVSSQWQKALETFEHAFELGYRDELVPPSTLEHLRQSDDADDDFLDELLEFLRENGSESRTPTNPRLFGYFTDP